MLYLNSIKWNEKWKKKEGSIVKLTKTGLSKCPDPFNYPMQMTDSAVWFFKVTSLFDCSVLKAGKRSNVLVWTFLSPIFHWQVVSWLFKTLFRLLPTSWDTLNAWGFLEIYWGRFEHSPKLFLEWIQWHFFFFEYSTLKIDIDLDLKDLLIVDLKEKWRNSIGNWLELGRLMNRNSIEADQIRWIRINFHFQRDSLKALKLYHV